MLGLPRCLGDSAPMGEGRCLGGFRAWTWAACSLRRAQLKQTRASGGETPQDAHRCPPHCARRSLPQSGGPQWTARGLCLLPKTTPALPCRPGPNAPLSWVRACVQVLDPKAKWRSKILLGLNFYGTDYSTSRDARESVVGAR